MIFIRVAKESDTKYISEILTETYQSALIRGTGIGKRSNQTLEDKIKSGKAIIATTAAGTWAGFCYLEVYEDGKYVSNSGLIVSPKFRNQGVANVLKNSLFNRSRLLYPQAKIFSITSSAAIMKMNSRLGFEPVTFAEITKDNLFWSGCKGCINFDILTKKQKCNCLCTAMLFTPKHLAQHLALSNILLTDQHAIP